MMLKLGAPPPWGQGDGCLELDWMDLEKKLLHLVLALWKKENLPKWPHVALQH